MWMCPPPEAEVISQCLFDSAWSRPAQWRQRYFTSADPSDELMPSQIFGPKDLLEYDARWGVLICRECQYAIQRSAVDSHLLRHKIYRGERQRLLSTIAKFDLLAPEDVPLPHPGSPAVTSLPITAGYRCFKDGCGCLLASSKRMRRHWSEAHGQRSEIVPGLSSFAFAVKLQTFYRGTKIRYFEVDSRGVADAVIDNNRDAGTCETKQGNQVDGEGGRPARSSSGYSPSALSEIVRPNIDLETLAYFHHFIQDTSRTIPGSGEPSFVAQYWQSRVVSHALGHNGLMCGLLAISAYHQATSSSDQACVLIHMEHAVHWENIFHATLEQLEPVSNDLQARHMCEQVGCLLRHAQRSLSSYLPRTDNVALDELDLIIDTIRTCPVGATGVTKKPPGESSSPNDLRSRLDQLPSLMADAFERPDDPNDVVSILSATGRLVACVEIAYGPDSPEVAWLGMATWLRDVPHHYYQMILRRKPEALVVMAHWAALLLRHAEDCGHWFLEGSSKAIMSAIIERFSSQNAKVRKLVLNLL